MPCLITPLSIIHSPAGEKIKTQKQASESSSKPGPLCISSLLEGARSVTDSVMNLSYHFPTALEPCTSEVAADLDAALRWARDSRADIDEELVSTGALIFRGFPFDTAEDFAAFTDALGYPNFAYQGAGGNAVRKNVVGDRVFTANESPPEKVIPFHCELAQCPEFPHRVLFFCDVPALEGGATPLLDCHRAYERLKHEAGRHTPRTHTHTRILYRYTHTHGHRDRPTDQPRFISILYIFYDEYDNID